jgi:serine protease
MKTKNLIRTLVALVATVCAAAFAFGAPDGNRGKLRRHPANRIPGSYIVVLKPDTAPADVDSHAASLAKVHAGKVEHSYRSAIRGFSARLTEQQAQAMSEDPRVEFIEEDGIASANTIQTSAPWGLDRVDQRDRPLSGTYDNGNLAGAGVTVYVIDSGIRTDHNEFGGRAYVGADFVGDGWNGQDTFGHGTHVAATIGGQTYGIAKGVTLCAVRVLDPTGHGPWSQVISGVDWVTANHTPMSVANMSIGGGASDAVDQAIRNSIASGVTYVVAAGNDSSPATNYSPSRVAEAIVVSATDSGDQRAAWANYGPTVDLFAPGVGIVSAGIATNSATATKDGTSMAAPHVAGLAAVYLQSRGGASPSMVANALIYSASTDKVGNPGTGTLNRLAYFGDAWAASGPLYRIVNVNSGYVLDVIGDSMIPGTRLDQWGYVGIPSQMWHLVPVGGAYKLSNEHSGLALEVEGDSRNAGARVDQWQYVGVASQQWYLVSVGSGQYKIQNVNSGLVLEVEGDSLSQGAYLDQWTYVGVASQHWRLEQVN